MGMFDIGQKLMVAFCTPWPGRRMPDGRVVHQLGDPEWMRARYGLSVTTNINMCEFFADFMEVGDARSRIAAACLSHQPRPEFLFFLDWDVIVPPDALTKLLFRARCFPDYDVYAGVYCCKGVNPPDPLIYRDCGEGAFWDWTVGDLLTTDQQGIRTVHNGLSLIRMSLFERMLQTGVVHGDGSDQDDEPFFKTVSEWHEVDGARMHKEGTEDFYFYAKAREVRCKIMVDTSVLAAHKDFRTGIKYGLPTDYGPAARAKWLRKGAGAGATSRDREEANGQKLALDLGAGEHRRAWPDHVTYTTDIRAETQPDYVMDTRLLNLPADHFDLVASSHHLEHLPRWEQEEVWREMFRVCRPGGAIEHIVPSLDWAAAKVQQGQCDEHAMNVFYGSQEKWGNGIKRDHNTHYFGYTKDIARALAESAGFSDVSCEDWRDNEDWGLNLVIRGKKPGQQETSPREEVLAALAATAAA